MANEIELRYLDKRTQERYVARGVISEKDLEKHLKSLPDLTDQALKVETMQPDLDMGSESAA
jgi:hypothetical protein